MENSSPVRDANVENNGPDVLFEKSDGIATLTLNRPYARNAVTANGFMLLEYYLKDIERDDSVRVVVLTGTHRHFCAGADLKLTPVNGRMPQQDEPTPEDEGGDVLERGQRCVLRLHRLPKPVIASISGNAIGLGCSLALACDLRIATVDAQFGLTFSRLGLGPDGGASYFLPHLVGVSKALELMYLADIFDAQTALSLGLLNRLVVPETLETETRRCAERLTRGSSQAYAYTKSAVQASAHQSLESILDMETRNQRIASRSQEVKDRISGFSTRR